MDREDLSLLCDPDTRYSFELEEHTLRNTATGRVYPVREGIPLFVSSLTGPNLRSQTMYDRLASGYDLGRRIGGLFGRTPDFRPEFIPELELRPGARVLEVAVGTGANLPYLPKDIDFYGVDISWGMLKKCRKNLKKWGRKAHLFQAEAAQLPFCAEIFDCVFHVCGFGFFTHKERAIKEMIWVAKPGAKIVIVDWGRKGVWDEDQANPAMKASMERSGAMRCPIDLVPEGMLDVKAQRMADDRLYCLSFRKPLTSSAATPGTAA